MNYKYNKMNLSLNGIINKLHLSYVTPIINNLKDCLYILLTLE